MTAIAAYARNGVVTMGGDSAAVEQSHYIHLAATPKVFEVGPLLIGYTTSFAMGHALQHRLRITPDDARYIPAANRIDELDCWMATTFTDLVRATMREVGYMKTENGRESGGQFLVGVKGHIYLFDDDFHANRVLEGYAACGSGVTACMAAFHALQSSAANTPLRDAVLIALRAAESCVTTVRGPFHVIEGGRA